MIGGYGDDSYYVADAGDTVVELGGEGVDRVYSTLSSYTLGDNVENLTLSGTAGSSGLGNGLNNQIVGNGGANLLSGGALGAADDRTVIQGDTNGDRIADFEIVLTGQLVSLQGRDMIL